MKNLSSYSINYQGLKQKKKDGYIIVIKVCTAILSIILLSILFISLFSFIGSGENDSNFIKHEVKYGESLWSISANYYDSDNVDLRKIVYNIKKLNNLKSSVITPGSEVIIPLN